MSTLSTFSSLFHCLEVSQYFFSHILKVPLASQDLSPQSRTASSICCSVLPPAGRAGNFILMHLTASPLRNAEEEDVEDTERVARLSSLPVTAPHADLCVSFWYHMLGQHPGVLHIRQQEEEEQGLGNILWTVSGHQGARWREGRVLLPRSSRPYRVSLKIECFFHRQFKIAALLTSETTERLFEMSCISKSTIAFRDILKIVAFFIQRGDFYSLNKLLNHLFKFLVSVSPSMTFSNKWIFFPSRSSVSLIPMFFPHLAMTMTTVDFSDSLKL